MNPRPFFSAFYYHLLISGWGGKFSKLSKLSLPNRSFGKTYWDLFASALGLTFFRICMNQFELVATGWNPFKWIWISLGLLNYVSVCSGSLTPLMKQNSIPSKWIEATSAWIEVDWTLVQLPWFLPSDSVHWLWVGCSLLCVQLIFFHVRPDIG